jgi:peptide/nickel transport system substrate-binding protein
VLIITSAPNPVLLRQLPELRIMSKAWSEKHKVTVPTNFVQKEESYAVRNANGTGPFMLERYEADKQTVLKANPKWWGRTPKDTGNRVGNISEARYLVIQSDATRLAALASGEVDFVIDPPFQDVARLKQDKRLRFSATPDIGTQYLTFDQFRDELQFSDVKGRNPFKDLRVRQAVYHAIDIELIIRKVLRGQAKSTGSFISAQVDGYVAELDRRLPFDPARSRALLKDAGYPDGFGVTLDCVNVKFREAVCQAISAMLTQVGIRTELQSTTSALFFPKLSQATASFVEYGWTPPVDPWTTFNAIFRTQDGKGAGAFNAGRYSNPKVDALVDAFRIEPDLAKRRRMVGDTLRLLHADLPYIPLYRRTLTWAMRGNVDVVQWPNDVLELRWARLD